MNETYVVEVDKGDNTMKHIVDARNCAVARHDAQKKHPDAVIGEVDTLN